LAIEPSHGALLENYATILIQSGDYQTALAVSQQVLRPNPGSNVYCLYLGAVSLLKLNRLQESLVQFDELLAIEPKHFIALNERGSVLAAMGRFDAALDSSERSLALQPQYAEAHLNRGNIHATLNRRHEAFAAFDKALALKADLGEAWLGRGNILRELKRHDEALAAFDKALTLRPGYAEGWLGRGSTFSDLRRYEALAANDKALALQPAFAEAWLGRGDVFFLLNRDDEAVSCFDKAISLKGDLADAHWNKSLARLSLGRYEEGWELYEWRWKLHSFTSPGRNFRQPPWLGDHALYDKTILIHSEQGLGDTVHFCRYLSFLDDRNCGIVFETPKPLVPLFQEGAFRLSRPATPFRILMFIVLC
jgi:tetratricopeptide (TPR) repeat protein